MLGLAGASVEEAFLHSCGDGEVWGKEQNLGPSTAQHRSSSPQLLPHLASLYACVTVSLVASGHGKGHESIPAPGELTAAAPAVPCLGL